MHGQGIYTWPDGVCQVLLVGLVGLSTERWPWLSVHALCPAGTTYVGEYKENLRSGRGIHNSADGTCRWFLWDRGLALIQCPCTLPYRRQV